jgi:hypothetical protein
MKAIANIFTLFLTSMYITTMHTNSQAIVANNNSSVPAVFVASTPCSSGTKPLPGIPREAGCELIKWELKLFGDIGKQTAGTYVLNCVYGMPNRAQEGL